MSGLLPGAVIAGKNTLEYAQKIRNLGYFTMTYYKRHTVAEVPVGANITVFTGCEGILIHLLLYPKIASLERIDLWQRHLS